MITAERLQQLIEMDYYELTNILNKSGYKDCRLDGARFLGLTTGGQLCYKVSFYNEHTGDDDVGKVFVSMKDGQLVAEY